MHSKQIKNQFTTKDGAKLNNWKDMKECDLEYGFQMKDFPDEEVKSHWPCRYGLNPRQNTHVQWHTPSYRHAAFHFHEGRSRGGGDPFTLL